jgi:membrane protein YdbS with pleckstrin-like domain
MAEKIRNTDFLKESNGKSSIMRLMSFLSLLWAFLLSFVVIAGSFYFNANVSYGALVIVGFFVVGAFAPKAIQRFAENKVEMK